MLVLRPGVQKRKRGREGRAGVRGHAEEQAEQEEPNLPSVWVFVGQNSHVEGVTLLGYPSW